MIIFSCWYSDCFSTIPWIHPNYCLSPCWFVLQTQGPIASELIHMSTRKPWDIEASCAPVSSTPSPYSASLCLWSLSCGNKVRLYTPRSGLIKIWIHKMSNIEEILGKDLFLFLSCFISLKMAENNLSHSQAVTTFLWSSWLLTALLAPRAALKSGKQGQSIEVWALSEYHWRMRPVCLQLCVLGGEFFRIRNLKSK